MPAFPRSATRSLRLRPLASCLLIGLAGGATIESHANTVQFQNTTLRDVRTSAPARLDAAPTATAGTVVTVLNCDDSGAGSLRDAYFQAVDGVTIDLTQLTCSRITLTTGALTDPGGALETGVAGVTLKGSGQTIDGYARGRVLVHNGTDTLAIDDLSIVNGTYSGLHGGGCIYSYGPLTLESSTVATCSLTTMGDYARGGAIYSKQKVTLTKGSAVLNSTANATKYGFGQGGGISGHGVFLLNSTVSGNAAIGGDKGISQGGGVFVMYGADVRGAVGMSYSTVSNNSADVGGGVYALGDVDIAYSTISGNKAKGKGGGLFSKANPSYAYPLLLIAQSTISGNRSGDSGGGAFLGSSAAMPNSTVTNNYAYVSGGGLYLEGAHNISSTIVAGNSAGVDANASDIGGLSAQLSGSKSLIQFSTLTLPKNTVTGDPRLGPLQDNGGPTFTHALTAGSAAIDKGTSVSARLNDQRGPGFPRTVGVGTDIGAFEFQDILFKNGFQAVP